MNINSKKYSFINKLLILNTIILFFSFLFTVIFFYCIDNFNIKKANIIIKEDLKSYKKLFMKEQALELVSYINLKQNSLREQMGIELKNDIENLHLLLSEIIKNSKNISNEELKSNLCIVIKKFYTNKKNTTVHIADTKGNIILCVDFPDCKSYFTQEFYNEKQILINNEIKFLIEKGDGYVKSSINKEHTEINFHGRVKKLYYKDWYLYMGFSEEKYLEELKNDISKKISNMLIGKDSYFTVIDYNGIILSHFLPDFIGKEFKTVYSQKSWNDLFEYAMTGKEFIEIGKFHYKANDNNGNTLNSIIRFREWNWIILNSYFTESLDKLTDNAVKGFFNIRGKNPLIIILVFLIIFSIFLILEFWLIKPLKKFCLDIVCLFEKNKKFKDKNKIKFKEFYSIAEQWNKSIDSRVASEEKLILAKKKFEIAIKSSEIGPWDYCFKENSIYLSEEFGFKFGTRWGLFSDYGDFKRKYIPEEDYCNLVNSLKLALKNSKGNLRFKHRIVNDDNKTLWLRNFGQIIYDSEGNPDRAIGIAEDITEIVLKEDELIKAKEKAEKADKIKSEFVASVTHELRTPMTAIIGFSELMLYEKDLPPKISDYVGVINNSANYLLNLINDILDVSRFETGIIETYPEPVEVKKIIKEVEKIFKPRVELDEVEFIVKYPDKEIIIITDSVRLKQILINILTNSLKFTKIGKIEFEVLIEGNYVVFSTKDTGIGIKANDIDKIFEKFSQADSSISKKYGGLGLGLSISKKLAELLGGFIKVQSEIDKGSEFKVYLPLKDYINK
ncbi:MAG: ATP-binding protein [Candidatus Muirbacterium halophilum]|nr:ATP-binding protein [Candidatus Muirbacterium halophilum]MCK9477641.1 ATP-binding protein [Candidatus Muirbacterium halophilum]